MQIRLLLLDKNGKLDFRKLLSLFVFVVVLAALSSFISEPKITGAGIVEFDLGKDLDFNNGIVRVSLGDYLEDKPLSTFVSNSKVLVDLAEFSIPASGLVYVDIIIDGALVESERVDYVNEAVCTDTCEEDALNETIIEAPEAIEESNASDIFGANQNKITSFKAGKKWKHGDADVEDAEFTVDGSQGQILVSVNGWSTNSSIENLDVSSPGRINLGKEKKEKSGGRQLSAQADEEASMVTDVLAMSLEGFENATLTLPASNKVDFIARCAEWDFENSNCIGGWEKTDIPFAQQDHAVTFTVTEFSAYAGASITVLNVITYLKDGDDWTVYFETEGAADLRISGVNNSDWTEFLTDNANTDNDEMRFIDLKCGETSLKDSLQLIREDGTRIPYNSLTGSDSVAIKALLIEDYNCEGRGQITNNMLIAGYATLKFEFGNDVAFAYDPPSLDSVLLNSSLGNNLTTENLTAFATGIDSNETVIYDWRKNGVSDAIINMPFDVNGSVGNASNIKDYSTWGNNGTLGNGSSDNYPKWNASCGAFAGSGGCYEYDGGDAIVIPYSNSINITSNMTIAMWFKPALIANSVMFGKRSGTDNGAAYMAYLISTGVVRFKMGNGTAQFSADTTATAPVNTWAFYTGKISGDVMSVYLNAVKGTDTTFLGRRRGGEMPIAIGKLQPSSVGTNFNGSLDQVMMWNRSLSDAEILMLYNAGAGKYNVTHSDATSEGDEWGVYVTPFDGITEGSTLVSNNVSIQVNAAPLVSSVSITPALPVKSDALNCTFTITDSNKGNNLYANVSWYKNSIISAAYQLSVSNGTQKSIYLAVGNTTKGENWTCTILPYDEFSYGTSSNASVIIQSTAPVISAVLVNSSLGNNLTTENLTAFVTAADNDSDPVSVGYDWRKNGVSDAVVRLSFNANSTDNSNVKDYSTWKNNGTLGNGSVTSLPKWNASCGAFAGSGGCYEFDGIDMSIAIPTTDSINLKGNMTVAFWFKAYSYTAASTYMFSKRAGTTTNIAYWGAIASTGNLTFNVGNGTANFAATSMTPITSGTWTFYAGKAEGNIVTVYKNGVRGYNTTVLGSRSTSTANLQVGRFLGTSVLNMFNGSIDQFVMWNRSLSDAEILMLYNAGAGKYNVTHSDATRKGEEWGVYVTAFDSQEGNTFVGNNVTILNTAPTAPNITMPYNLSTTNNLTVTIGGATDIDNDNLNYTLWASSTSDFSNAASYYNSTILSTYPQDTVSVSDGAYYLRALAFDGAANSSSWSSTVNVTFDTAKPHTIALDAPGEAEVFGTASVNFNWTAYDGIDTNLSCNLTLDGIVNVSNKASLNGTAINYTIQGIAEGSHAWNITCRDDASNANTSATRNLTVDTNAPHTIALNAPGEAEVFGTASVNLNWTAYDGIDTNLSCNLTLDGIVNVSNKASLNGTTVNYTIQGIAEGTHQWNITCRDDASNANTSATRNFTVSITAPVITLISPINNSGDNDGNVTFNYNVTSGFNISNCSIIISKAVNYTDTSVAKNITQNITVNNLPVGAHNWSVNCTDVNNNRGSSETRLLSVIKTTGFSGSTTDLSNVQDIANISNMVIDFPSDGKINFTENVNLSGGANINDHVNISFNRIEINSTALPGMNRSATLYLYNLTFSNPRILMDGSVCPSAVCAKTSYSGGTLIFNVSHFTTYSAGETPTVTTAAAGVSGAGASSAVNVTKEEVKCKTDADCAEDESCLNNVCVKLFDVKVIRVDTPIQPEEHLDFTYFIKGMADIEGDVIVEFWLEKDGEVITSGFDTLYMGSFEEKTETTSIFLPKDIALGAYDFYVKLSYDGYEAKARRVIEIGKEVPLVLDIMLSDIPALTPEDKFEFETTLSFNKDEPALLQLNAKITKGDEIIWTKDKEMEVTRHKTIIEEVGKLDPGNYQLELVATYGEGRTAVLTQNFSVQPEKKDIYLLPVLMGVALFILCLLFYLTRKGLRKAIAREQRWAKLHMGGLLFLIFAIIAALVLYYFHYMGIINLSFLG